MEFGNKAKKKLVWKTGMRLYMKILRNKARGLESGNEAKHVYMHVNRCHMIIP